MSDHLVLDQAKMRIGPNDGHDTEFLVKRIGEVICGGYTTENPYPEKKRPGYYTLQKKTNNHWLVWREEEEGLGEHWEVVFRYPPRDEEFVRALKIVLEAIRTIIP